MVRLYTRGIALKSFAQMRRVLDDLDAVVTRAIGRVPKSVTTGRLVICAVLAVRLALKSVEPAPEGADTS